jgi:hypothetical protein
LSLLDFGIQQQQELENDWRWSETYNYAHVRR